jgi:hypothetical protein
MQSATEANSKRVRDEDEGEGESAQAANAKQLCDEEETEDVPTTTAAAGGVEVAPPLAAPRTPFIQETFLDGKGHCIDLPQGRSSMAAGKVKACNKTTLGVPIILQMLGCPHTGEEFEDDHEFLPIATGDAHEVTVIVKTVQEFAIDAAGVSVWVTQHGDEGVRVTVTQEGDLKATTFRNVGTNTICVWTRDGYQHVNRVAENTMFAEGGSLSVFDLEGGEEVYAMDLANVDDEVHLYMYTETGSQGISCPYQQIYKLAVGTLTLETLTVHFDEVHKRLVLIGTDASKRSEKILTILNLPVGGSSQYGDCMSIGPNLDDGIPLSIHPVTDPDTLLEFL